LRFLGPDSAVLHVGRLFAHALSRSIILVLLAILLTSNWSNRTVFEFPNVLAQIGLGYWIVFLLSWKGVKVQLPSTLAILLGYWLFFYLWYPGREFFPDYAQLPDDWEKFTGPLAAHWNKYVNAAGAVDVYFLNGFPREEPFWFNRGGYQTLNFVPSMATMLCGVMAGSYLRTMHSTTAKFFNMTLCALLLLAVGMTIDHTIWPDWFAQLVGSGSETTGFLSRDWTLCPIVKRIWTPSWVVFSTGWTLLLLAVFYLIIDGVGFQRWAYPLVVVGMNSITIYMMAQLMKPWIWKTLTIHFGYVITALQESIGRYLIDPRFDPMVRPIAVLVVLWLICWWLYRNRIFIRI
jgi:heparan-alpha-glucosaminide N-acetyltransferase